jgi:hypothetical protein
LEEAQELVAEEDSEVELEAVTEAVASLEHSVVVV